MKKIKQLLLVSAMATLLVACGGDKDDAAKTAEKAVKAMFSGDSKDLVDSMYTGGKKLTDEQKKQAEAMLTLISQSVKQKVDEAGGIKSVKAGEVTLNGDKTEATVPVTVTLNKAVNGQDSNTQTMKLRKEDGKWKIVQ